MTVVTPETDRILTRALAKAERVLFLSDCPSVRPAVPEGAIVSSSPSEGPFDAVVVDAAATDVAAIGDLTRDGGHVVIDFSALHGPELRRLAPKIVIELCEAGFAVQEPKEICDNALEFETGVTPPYVVAWKDRFRVRRYRQGDENEILEMFKRSFYSERPVGHWKWEYTENPYDKYPISLMVDETGKIVVHYAAYHVPVWRANAPYPTVSVQICDTMTDVGVRHVGRGHTSLLIRTIRHFYAWKAVNKVAFVYGFNTANIRKICVLYIGGKVIDDGVGFWTRPLAAFGAPRTNLVSRLLGGTFTARVEPLSPEFDSFFDRVAPSYEMLLLRKVEYLNWRYAASASANYEIVVVRRRGRIEGWSIFRRKDDDLVWVDALFDPKTAPGAAPEALRIALNLPIAAGAKRMIAWFPDERPSWWTAIVRGLGFAREKEPNELAMVAAAFTDPDAWNTLARMYYAAGDSDLY